MSMSLAPRVLQQAHAVVSKQTELCKAIAKSCPELYFQKCPLVGAAVGSHVRHSLDHFTALTKIACPAVLGRPSSNAAAAAAVNETKTNSPMQDMTSKSSSNCVDYDKRIRGTLAETSAMGGVEALEMLLRDLQALSEDPTVVSGSLETAKAAPRFMICGETGQNVDFESTILREMWFVTHHAIHHNAMIQVAIKSISQELAPAERKCLQAALPEGFALAPSTANNCKAEPVSPPSPPSTSSGEMSG